MRQARKLILERKTLIRPGRLLAMAVSGYIIFVEQCVSGKASSVEELMRQREGLRFDRIADRAGW